MGCHGEEFGQLFAGVFLAVGAVLNLLLLAALPYFANIAVVNNPLALRLAAIAVDVLRFNGHLVLLGPGLGDLLSFGVIVLLSRLKCRAFSADYSTVGNHFVHSFLLFVDVGTDLKVCPYSFGWHSAG